jgi:hypothetical protein
MHDVDAKWQPAYDLVNELDRRALVAGVVDLEHADPGTIIDGGELIQALPRSGNPLEELHIQLQPLTRLRLLVPLPALRAGPMLLARRGGGARVTLLPDRGCERPFSMRGLRSRLKYFGSPASTNGAPRADYLMS